MNKMEKLNTDCFILIFNELRKDNKSLYSCLLVNKEWCHLVIPILWEGYPYSNCEKSQEKFSNVILSCLPSYSKQLLFDINIKVPSNSPTFNYVSFCKFLRVGFVGNIIYSVFKEEVLNNSKKKRFLEQEIYKLFINQCKNIRELVWRTFHPLQSYPGAMTSFSQLHNLAVDLNYVNSNNLYETAQICKNLGILTISAFSQDVRGLISLIDEQRNLKVVSLNFCINEGTFKELSKALARKGHTINNLSLYDSVGFTPHSFLTSLNNLKVLTIYHNNCKSYEGIEEFQKYLANSIFPDLEILEISNLLCFKEFAMLIEKTKGNILDIYVNIFNKSANNTGMLISAISNHCPKIEHLTTHLGPNDLIYVRSLLMNCKNLIRLSLNSLNEKNGIGDELLNILAELSPKSLTDIEISGDWEYPIDTFVKFFESYKERNLLSFVVRGYFCYMSGEPTTTTITTEHVNIVRKYYNEGIVKSSNLLSHHFY
ncbi:unnamed protein product [Rhizophagus irregularis]|uniref:F-box domain-containing protein n=1 Tax=Rhizophagus irregularis TaxID=588596 RepID=A0A915YPX6_9GLOM|nr:unnamed protein product [Rhizophagus irregularis]